MSQRYKKLSHTIYECKYHFSVRPKYRFGIFKDEITGYNKQQTYILCRDWSILTNGAAHPRHLVSLSFLSFL